MVVITPKHVGAVLVQILILILKLFSCASVGDKTLIITDTFRIRHFLGAPRQF